ncbi:hypothetical protein EAG_15666 [Camponotus floridanus]|uniref:Uncharacterized protein n=1 Tax=Camponotus floridanus TaxID=104421 RepID=E2AIV2_CAMFO|nr:hypothetical protein EAG_15666 [Camponotus floridanus]
MLREEEEEEVDRVDVPRLPPPPPPPPPSPSLAAAARPSRLVPSRTSCHVASSSKVVSPAATRGSRPPAKSLVLVPVNAVAVAGARGERESEVKEIFRVNSSRVGPLAPSRETDRSLHLVTRDAATRCAIASRFDRIQTIS